VVLSKKRKEDGTMRTFFKVCMGMVLVILCLAVTSSSVLAAKKYEGETMQVFIGITPLAREQVVDYIAPRLKEKYGINLAGETMGSTGMVEKIVVMKDNPRVSIAGWDTPIGVRAAEMGLCAKIDVAKVPNLKNMYDWAIIRVDGDVKVLTTAVIGVGILYNEDEFKRKGLAPPTSWSDLWRKDLSGRVSITALESTWGTAALVVFARLEGGGEDNIDPGFKKVKTVLPYVHTIHTWSSELTKLLQLGEVWMGTTGSNMGPALRAKGFPAKWVAPKEASPMVNGGMSIIANAPYQDVAHDFLDLYFSEEFQLRRMRESGIVSPIKTVWDKLSKEEIEALPITDKDFDKLMRLDWTKINKERASWIERWHKEIK
jgi:putative spermidine/putrescine transport system substrate-binding protein